MDNRSMQSSKDGRLVRRLSADLFTSSNDSTQLHLYLELVKLYIQVLFETIFLGHAYSKALIYLIVPTFR
jgi:hypothetical protein